VLDAVPEWFRSALATPVEDRSVVVDGCRIAFRRWGSADLPALVLVHGGAANSRWWDHVGPLFSRECCVSALDLSGHGDSGRRAAYSFDQWADEIAAVAAASAGPHPPVVVGHSLGGFATFRAGARHGSELEGVVIIDSPVREPSPEEEAARRREAFGPLRTYASAEEAMARFRPVPDQPQVLPYVVDHVKQHSVRQVEGGWTWKFDPTFTTASGHVGPDTLAAIACRVAVLRPEHGLVTPDIGRHMYELLGRTAPVIEVPLAYHHVMLDQPIALVAALRALLADWRHSYSMRAAL
jgi:pimeloyl-ACP methyl ester carboxylesterase